MHSRISLIACSILALTALLPGPARAESRYATDRFEILFADGWQQQPSLIENDSTLSLMYSYSMMGYCYLTATEADQPVFSGDFESVRKQFGGTDSLRRVDEGADILGGRTFSFVEYDNADTSGGHTRIRLYSTSVGSLRFQSMLVYDLSAGPFLVAEMDSALSALSFTPTALRPSAAARRPPAQTAGHDILGRLRPLAMRSVLFRLPER